MEQGEDRQGSDIQEENGDMVAGDGHVRILPIPNITIDLDAKIHRYLSGLHTKSWPMRVFSLHDGEIEHAEAWIKELIGKVLNA